MLHTIARWYKQVLTVLTRDPCPPPGAIPPARGGRGGSEATPLPWWGGSKSLGLEVCTIYLSLIGTLVLTLGSKFRSLTEDRGYGRFVLGTNSRTKFYYYFVSFR